jgi:hypothetical protein
MVIKAGVRQLRACLGRRVCARRKLYRPTCKKPQRWPSTATNVTPRRQPHRPLRPTDLLQLCLSFPAGGLARLRHLPRRARAILARDLLRPKLQSEKRGKHQQLAAAKTPCRAGGRLEA